VWAGFIRETALFSTENARILIARSRKMLYDRGFWRWFAALSVAGRIPVLFRSKLKPRAAVGNPTLKF
jgi:hypothetical protein